MNERSPAVEIRRAGPRGWATVRRLRLDALRESPFAFLGSYAVEQAWTPARWRRACVEAVWFVASVEGAPVGLTRVARYPDEPRHIESMWVAPEYRKCGVAAALLAMAERSVRARGDLQIGLWVYDGNDVARQFYEEMGYRLVDRRDYAPAQDGRTEREFLKQL